MLGKNEYEEENSSDVDSIVWIWQFYNEGREYVEKDGEKRIIFRDPPRHLKIADKG